MHISLCTCWFVDTLLVMVQYGVDNSGQLVFTVEHLLFIEYR